MFGVRQIKLGKWKMHKWSEFFRQRNPVKKKTKKEGKTIGKLKRKRIYNHCENVLNTRCAHVLNDTKAPKRQHYINFDWKMLLFFSLSFAILSLVLSNRAECRSCSLNNESAWNSIFFFLFIVQLFGTLLLSYNK